MTTTLASRVPPTVEAYGDTYARRIEAALADGNLYVLDTETDGLDGAVWAIGVMPLTDGGVPRTFIQQSPTDTSWLAAAADHVRTIQQGGGVFVIHNAKFDRVKLANVGIHIYWDHVLDTQLLAYCWDPSVESLSLAALTGEKLDFRGALIDAGLLKASTKKGTEYTLPPWQEGVLGLMTQYLVGDLLATRSLCNRVLPSLMGDPKAWWHFTRIEAPFTRLIVGMESRGFGFNVDAAKDALATWEAEQTTITQELQARLGYMPGEEKVYKRGYHTRNGVTTYNHCTLVLFNPNSGPHCRAAFERFGYKPTKLTEKGETCLDDGVLKEMTQTYRVGGAVHTLASKLRQLHKLAKYIGMVRGYIEKATWSDEYGCHILRGEFNQTVARTGRLSSSNP